MKELNQSRENIMKSIGFIGTGNMGGAVAIAAAKSKAAPEILLANRTREKAEKLAEKIGGKVCTNMMSPPMLITFSWA